MTEWEPLNQAIEDHCLSNTTCSLNLSEVLDYGAHLPPECSSSVPFEEQGFHLSMQCLPQDIYLPFLEEPVTREMMSMVCVMADLLISILLYFSLLCLKNF
mmetsp:Transcript_2180/g.3248  ORF Transcript_2180/g.3248 Transcript_2180/m.3248 type:complete len:101 (+) Transcript_2180:1404-1706(+)